MLKVILMVGLTLASTAGHAARIELSGEVTYRERIALPPDAMLTIELIDLAFPDRPRVSVTAPTGAGQVPLAFSLSLDESIILPQHKYAIEAEISAGDIRFRNAEPYPVTPLNQTEPIVIMTQRMAPQEPSSEEPTGDTSLALIGITWQATRIGDAAVPPGIDVTFLVAADMRAGGTGGCNSYFSQAAITADSFAIGEVSRTLRSCGYDRNMIEQSYYDALRKAASWQVTGNTLVLLDTSGKPTVTFERT